MEINAIHQMRRAAVRTDEKKKDVQAAASGSANTPPKADSLSLTGRMAAGLKEQSQRIASLLEQDRQEEKTPEPWDMLDGASGEDGDDEADMLGEQLKVMQRCQKIAARIMRGDKVPPEDERYLMENDPDGYKLALAMRTPKKKPKEWDSVLEEEKEKTSETSGEEETASSCEASGGASDTGGAAGGAADSGE